MLLRHLIDVLGYPQSCIAIERELSSLPHLRKVPYPLPLRRADLVCFAKDKLGSGELFPLLLIECKAVKLTPKMENQVVGYNHFLKAAFIALVNQHEARTGWFDKQNEEYQFIPTLPSYEALLNALKRG